MGKYTKLIPENIAVTGARRIGIYNKNGNRVGFIPLDNLAIPTGNKLYSFGALSDIHLQADTAQADFQKALTYLNDAEDVAFTCICGDLSQNGTDNELQVYKAVVNNYSPDTPVYAIFGNHDGNGGLHNSTETYTGQPLHYSFTHGDDVFIMMGVISGKSGDIGTLFKQESLQWLYDTLEANRNKRCFLFQHVLSKKSSGDALNIYPYTKLSGDEATVFESMLSHYPNVIWFHGHSHMKFAQQENGDNANYDKVFGCHSIHIPSLSVPRDQNATGTSYSEVYADSEGYVVDVYENGIHLRGRDFVRDKFIPIASYWLDTTLKNVDAGEYYDDVGAVVSTKLKYELSADGSHYICVGTQENFTDTTVTVDDTLNGLPVLAVGAGAFSNAPTITKVTFESTPETIASDAFTGCDSLATVVMPGNTDALDNLPWGSGTLRPRFEIGGVIYRIHNSNSNRYVLDGTTSAFKGGVVEFIDYVGPVRVYEIDSSSFKNKTTITELVIPASIYAVEASVFSGCTGLTKVTFLGTPNSIPTTAFENCPNLLDIYVPWAEGAKANAPWGATNATIHYNS